MKTDEFNQRLAEYAAGLMTAEEREAFACELLREDDGFIARAADATDAMAALIRALAPAAQPRPEAKRELFAKLDIEPRPAVPKPEAALAEGLRFLTADKRRKWFPLRGRGASAQLLTLNRAQGYAIVLAKLEAGASYPEHDHRHGESIYMLSGDLTVGDTTLGPGDFHQAEPGSHHAENRSENGCTVLAVLSTTDLRKQLVGL